MLGKAVHSLSRIGDELYLEPLDDGVRNWAWGWADCSPESGLTVTRSGQNDPGQIRSLLPGCWSITLGPVFDPGGVCMERSFSSCSGQWQLEGDSRFR